MSFLAKLEIDGESMNVLEFQCTLGQDTDKSGKPAADPAGGKIRVVVESTKSTMLFDWMVSNSQTKNGKLTFYRRDAISKMRELQFKEAYCIRYDEIFVAYNSMSMKIEIVISAKEINMNGSQFARNWPLKL
ncbi:type VI secretion system tube protein TssD [Flavobacterium sp. DG1-102-2]|uniref:type VI secretion system tube protein TssD n=1 Tax=Flavobacterium sp. DG1-102-2 TaxID=3081663 RepID=UPI002949A0AC|nr:type VI secretion system tube protein TssD [Flavobacterium sp. DG1-102-2]MDV6167383.1 type VI secretion system tube protein TssD [Flavobacterium sp. DG1-102-2]